MALHDYDIDTGYLEISKDEISRFEDWLRSQSETFTRLNTGINGKIDLHWRGSEIGRITPNVTDPNNPSIYVNASLFHVFSVERNAEPEPSLAERAQDDLLVLQDETPVSDAYRMGQVITVLLEYFTGIAEQEDAANQDS